MKCLTLTEPWATLVAIGAKRIETRSWRTSYRGQLAIHSAKGFPKYAREFALSQRVVDLTFPYFVEDLSYLHHFPRGHIIAVCYLKACVRTESLLSNKVYAPDMTEQEQAFGDYSEGRWGWILGDVQMLPDPIPAKGALGLWEWVIDVPNPRLCAKVEGFK